MINFTDYIDPYAFFISLIIGLIIHIYFMKPKKYVIKYPNPQESEKTIYKDDSENCYKYKSEEVQCPSDKSSIQKIPIQNVENKKEDDDMVKRLSNAFDYKNN